MKTRFDTAKKRFEIKDGRKIVEAIATTLPPKVANGLIAGLDPEYPDLEAARTALLDAIENAEARRGSVIPDTYRHQYGVEQSCNDDVAKRLTAKVTGADGVDLEACREVAAANGIEDRLDGWLTKELNPGMIRMNLGNVLRGKQRRGEEVIGL